MRKFHYAMCLINCLLYQHLWGQHLSMGKQRLASHPVFDYNTKSSFVDFYEKVPPGDTIFRLSIYYNNYQDYLLSFLQSPVFRYVQELHISGPFDELPPAIAHLKQLKILFVNNYHPAYGGGDCPLYIPNELYRLPELEVLSLFTGNISISDSIIHLKKLKHLYISPVSLLPCLFTDMPQLKSIALNTYLLNKTYYLNVCGKLLLFNINPYKDADSLHYGADDTGTDMTPAPNRPINENINIKLKDPDDKKHLAFSFKGTIKNNEATGPWTVKCDYHLLANYSTGKTTITTVMMNDTLLLATVTKNNQGEELQEFGKVKKQFKNGIPYGTWKYHADNGIYDQQIVYDDLKQTYARADTSGYLTRKTFVNGQPYGTWKEVTGYSVKTTEFENGKPLKITDREEMYRTPDIVREFKYEQTGSSIHTYYREKSGQSYIYSKESYNNYIPEGDFILYHSNGNILEKKTYSKGKITGDVSGYYQNGKLSYIKSYEQGLIKHERRFHSNGIMAEEVYYNTKGKHGTENAWSEEGRLRRNTYYENGLAFGVSQAFDDKRQVSSERYYEHGLAIYDDFRNFDDIFINSKDDKLLRHFYSFKMEEACFRAENCTQKKKVINDSTFMITAYQYTEKNGRHLKYIKEFNFKNYKLSGPQVLKDSAGNIIQYVHCKAGLREGKFTLAYNKDSLSLNYSENRIMDTVLTYYSHRSRSIAIQHYKNRQLCKTEHFYILPSGKSLSNTIVEYVHVKPPKPEGKDDLSEQSLDFVMGPRRKSNNMFFTPETVTEYTNGKKTKTVKFHATITKVNCRVICKVKGYAIADGKKEHFVEDDETKYEYWFRRYSVFNIFYNGWTICY